MPRKRKVDIPIPEVPAKLITRKVTTTLMNRGVIGNQVKAHFYIPGAIKFFKALLTNLEANDPRAIETAGKVFGFLADGKSGNTFNIQQTNANQARSEAGAVSQSKPGLGSPDEIYRMLAQERQERSSGNRTIEYVATPIIYDKDGEHAEE